jgi:hypothetical protein
VGATALVSPCVFKRTTNSTPSINDDDWSSDDDKGTVWAYDFEGNVKWVEYLKTGEKLKTDETVVPYVGVVNTVCQDAQCASWWTVSRRKYCKMSQKVHTDLEQLAHETYNRKN